MPLSLKLCCLSLSYYLHDDIMIIIRYIDMLLRAKELGYVHSITNLYDDCFTVASSGVNTASGGSQITTLDPTGMPYMDGDYWVGEAENVLKDLVSTSSVIHSITAVLTAREEASYCMRHGTCETSLRTFMSACWSHALKPTLYVMCRYLRRSDGDLLSHLWYMTDRIRWRTLEGISCHW